MSNSNINPTGIITFPSFVKPINSWCKLDYARAYVSAGFSVIPVRPFDKKPLIPWKEYQSRMAIDHELVEWFGSGDNNIGIVTGKISEVIVVDADTEEAVAFAEANGLANAPCVRTSKGAHYYCEYTEGVRNFQKRTDLPGIDLRAEGGYVVAPPSIHESGVQYQWQKGKDFIALPLAVIPGWVLQKPVNVASNPPATMVHSKPEQSSAHSNADSNFPLADFDKVVKECAFIGYCKRDPACLTEAEWYAMITVAVRCRNGEQCVHQMSQLYPGYSWSETQKKIEHALQNSKPRTCQDIEQNINGAHCKKCAHHGKINSPISLGRESERERIISEAVAEMNKEYALVICGERLVVFYEKFDNDGRLIERKSLSVQDFKNFNLNRTIEVPSGNKGESKTLKVADCWLAHELCRRLSGVEFSPNVSMLDVYNTCRAMPFDPKQGDWSLYRKHLVEIICDGDVQVSEYVLAWMAQIVQTLGGTRPETAIVLRGEQGTGKGVFATFFGKLFGIHFKHITQKNHLVGQFNNLLVDTIVVFWDEASLTNDVHAESTLKSMITEDTVVSEIKYQNAVETKNYINLIMASNNEWVIPASWDDRRYLVLDVSNKRRQDYKYFEAICKQMNNGGMEAMLFDLLQLDVSMINLKQAPKTAGLLNQKLNSLGSVEKYWYERLYSGSFLNGQDNSVKVFNWGAFIPTQVLHDDYIQSLPFASRGNAAGRPLFAKKLKQICHDVNPCQRTNFGHPQTKGYDIPELDICRNNFDRYIKANIEWDID